MYIVTLKDQLGNQMFAYAAIKCLAYNKQIAFGTYNEGSYYQNSKDGTYGNSVASIFSIPSDEQIVQLPEEFQIYNELPLKERKGNYWKQIEAAEDNTLFSGHFISCKYFTRNYDEIRSWFPLPVDINNQMRRHIGEIKAMKCAKRCCSVHFRVGKDYTKLGYLMRDDYWTRAAKMIQDKDPDCAFVVFYDKKTKYVTDFIKRFAAIELHGSLVEDMAGIGACDYHIVCNSTFSIMSAFLSPQQSYIIRPFHYYAGIHKLPDDIWPQEWQSCKCQRSLCSFALACLLTLYVKTPKIECWRAKT